MPVSPTPTRTPASPSRSRLADAQGHRASARAPSSSLRGDEGVDALLSAARRLLDDRAPFADVAARLDAVMAELDDVAAELRSRTEAIDEDPERLEHILERRQLLVDLRRKYGESLDEVMAFHAEADDRLRELLDYDRRAAELDHLLADARHAADDAARAVRDRSGCGARVGDAVGNGSARWRSPTPPWRSRSASTTPTSPVTACSSCSRPIRDHRSCRCSASPPAASWPERCWHCDWSSPTPAATMPSARSCSARSTPASAGSAASAVGAALADLGRHHQVLVVTHLAQVAGRAARQFVVAKSVRGDATFTDVVPVDGDARLDEVARMLSGSVTDKSRQAAGELLEGGAPVRDGKSTRSRR
ncbi:MAG: hypothetical protein R2697_10480 [Ilumatobacteraceae bacterium]